MNSSMRTLNVPGVGARSVPTLAHGSGASWSRRPRWVAVGVLAVACLAGGCAGSPDPGVESVASTPAGGPEQTYLLAVEASSPEAWALGEAELLRIGNGICRAQGVLDAEGVRDAITYNGVSESAAGSIAYQAETLLCRT